MKYRFEYNGNPDYVTLHTTCKVVDRYLSDYDDTTTESEHTLRSLIAGVRGCMGVGLSNGTIQPYTISVRRGLAFERDEILQSLFETVVMWLKMDGQLQEGEELVQLPTLRSDIRVIQCEGCRREQDKEIAATMRDFDTLGD